MYDTQKIGDTPQFTELDRKVKVSSVARRNKQEKQRQ